MACDICPFSLLPQPRLISHPPAHHVFISHAAAADSIAQQLLTYLTTTLNLTCACGYTLMSSTGEGNRQAAMQALMSCRCCGRFFFFFFFFLFFLFFLFFFSLMSCSVFVCIASSADLGPEELQGECTDNLLMLSLALGERRVTCCV